MLKTVQLINTSSFGNGTVIQVEGNGTVNGITLTGNVTTSGNLTLGGTLSNIANSQLSNSSVTIGNTTISLGSTATSLGNIALANVSTTGLTGYLYGNDGTGNVTASTTIPNTGLANNTITLGNATLTLGSTTTAVGNLTLNNVTITSGTENNVTYTNATISSVKTTFPNSYLTNNSVTIGNTSVSLGSTVTSFGNVTLTNPTFVTPTLGVANATSIQFGSSTVLNDYEEGGWTPTYSSTGATFGYTQQYGSYVKIGKLVYAQFYLNVTVSGTTTNSVTITGLPFTTTSFNTPYEQGFGGAWSTNSQSIAFTVNPGATIVTLWKQNTSVAFAIASNVSGLQVGTLIYRSAS